MGRKGCPELMLLLLFNAVVWMEAMVKKTIYFHAQKLTWTEARQYCQRMYIDMLTWDTTDMDQVTKWLVETNYHEVWIGLRRDPEQPLVWRWINVKTGEGLTGEDVSESENWVTNPQPNVSCAAYNSLKKKWYSTVCTEQLKFVCYDDNLELVTENKTWDDAINHCRKMSSSKSKCDLLSTTTSSQFSYVRDRIYNATSEEVWTGLRFLGGEWWWSDGETLDHQGMLPDCPSQWEHCGTMSKYNTANWITRDCSERRNFICYCTEVAED